MEKQTSLAEIISALYEEFMTLYGDEELASVATAAVVNDLLSRQKSSIPEDVIPS